MICSSAHLLSCLRHDRDLIAALEQRGLPHNKHAKRAALEWTLKRAVETETAEAAARGASIKAVISAQVDVHVDSMDETEIRVALKKRGLLAPIEENRTKLAGRLALAIRAEREAQAMERRSHQKLHAVASGPKTSSTNRISSRTDASGASGAPNKKKKETRKEMVRKRN